MLFWIGLSLTYNGQSMSIFRWPKALNNGFQSVQTSRGFSHKFHQFTNLIRV